MAKTRRRGAAAPYGALLLASGLGMAALLPAAAVWAQERVPVDRVEPAQRAIDDDLTTTLNAEYTVVMRDVRTGGSGPLGTITLRPAPGGVRIIPDIKGLSPGPHGFYVYREPDCGTAPDLDFGSTREEAGTLLSPRDRDEREPGELPPGVLPPLVADEQGQIATAMTVTGIDFRSIVGRSLIITDEREDRLVSEDPPQPEWVACGIVRN